MASTGLPQHKAGSACPRSFRGERENASEDPSHGSQSGNCPKRTIPLSHAGTEFAVDSSLYNDPIQEYRRLVNWSQPFSWENRWISPSRSRPRRAYRDRANAPVSWPAWRPWRKSSRLGDSVVAAPSLRTRMIDSVFVTQPTFSEPRVAAKCLADGAGSHLRLQFGDRLGGTHRT